jgi:hypothetical protein
MANDTPVSEGADVSSVDIAGRELPDHSIDSAVARLLGKRQAQPEKEPEQKQLDAEPQEEVSEDEVEAEESETSDNPETEEESEETGEEEGELYFTVKLDGEEYEVSAEELKSGYQRQKDYTKKTQQLAEQRKDYEVRTTELTEQYDRFMQNASIADEVLNRDIKQFESVDWQSLKVNDPVGFVQKQIELNDVRQLQAQLRQQAQLGWEHNQKVAAEEHSRLLERERKIALETFPEWKNQDKATAHQIKIVNYAKSLGFEDSELNAISRTRHLLILDKARKYDELQKTKSEITEKVKPTMRKLVKTKGTPAPGSAQKKASMESRDRLRKSGSIRDAAAIMYEMQNSRVLHKPK